MFDRHGKAWHHPLVGSLWPENTNGGSPMSIEAHLESLQRKHGDLESQISQILSRPSPDQVELTQLKREKLRLKEEIEKIRSVTRH
jgi:hypothetical protein